MSPITKLMRLTLSMLTMSLVSVQAFAGQVGTIPEPDVSALLGLGGAAMVAVIIRNRRNKK